MKTVRSKPPNWDQLYRIAAIQDGHFTTPQAHDSGFSDQLLVKYIFAGRIKRVRRSVYRIVHFPTAEHEELMVAWLWSEREGVFSHETALSLQSLSDALPSKGHLTLPVSWRKRRLRIPESVEIHYADVTASDRTWIGSIPITNPVQTLRDCAESDLSPEVIHKAVEDALRRGLIDKKEAKKLRSVVSA